MPKQEAVAEERAAQQPAEKEFIHGSDGRKYERLPSGRLAEVFDPKEHAERQLKAIEGMTIAGLRLNSLEKPEEGVVVTFTPDEAQVVVAAVKKVLQARK